MRHVWPSSWMCWPLGSKEDEEVCNLELSNLITNNANKAHTIVALVVVELDDGDNVDMLKLLEVLAAVDLDVNEEEVVLEEVNVLVDGVVDEVVDTVVDETVDVVMLQAVAVGVDVNEDEVALELLDVLVDAVVDEVLDVVVDGVEVVVL